MSPRGAWQIKQAVVRQFQPRQGSTGTPVVGPLANVRTRHPFPIQEIKHT
ncbi:hypothetical protein ABT030_50860 [Streptomyces mirabilis]